MRCAALCREVLKLDGDIQMLAQGLKDSHSLLLFGRGYNYATALEAALKVHLSLTRPHVHDAFPAVYAISSFVSEVLCMKPAAVHLRCYGCGDVSCGLPVHSAPLSEGCMQAVPRDIHT